MQNKVKQLIKHDIVRILLVMLFLYILIMVIWNISNKNIEHKPSGLLWDFRKEGYKDNILEDRKEID